jgi:predicted dehydrogenase
MSAPVSAHQERPVVVPRAEGHSEDEPGLPGPAPVGWGVLGASSRVAQLAVLPALAGSPKARIVALGSASGEIGDTFGADRVHDRYDDVLADPAVDAVYVPLPNSLHTDWVCRAAEAGKHVLCEKPLAPTVAEARTMVTVCERAGVTLMEAYMTPFHPRSTVLEDILRSGQLGDLRYARSVFTGVLTDSTNHRWRPEMGGGALFDLGVYCLAPLLVAAQRLPVEVVGSSVNAPTGVDASFAGWLDFGDGFTASVECSFEAPARQLVEVVGTEASVTVHQAFTPGPDDVNVHLRRRDGTVEDVGWNGGDPYRGMVDHFCTVLQNGDRLRRPPSQSIEVLVVLETLRAAANAR